MKLGFITSSFAGSDINETNQEGKHFNKTFYNPDIDFEDEVS